MNDKESVLKEFNIIRCAYEKALQNLNSYNFKHPTSAEIQKKYSAEIKKLLDGVIEEVNLLNSQIVWDHLVIAFFGETGAGKSTIIETLRLKYSENINWEHGSIVGDGQSDYTKMASEYTLIIDGRKVTLIDVPGIEGNERKYEELIREALRKAHIVFYVQGKNRKPDSEIAKKIYNYLSDWTRVFSIYNIRGNIESYELQEDLNSVITEKTLKISKEITECFKSLLGKLYLGNMSLQALIALAASSNFPANKTLAKQNQRVDSLFGSDEVALKFSNFIVLKNQILQCSSNFTEIIKDSGLQKAAGLKIKGRNNLNNIYNEYNESVRNLISKILESNRKIKNLINSAKNKIESKINYEVDNKISELRGKLTTTIKSSSNHKESTFKIQLSRFKDSLRKSIESIVRDIFNNTEKQVSSYIKEFEKYGITKLPEHATIQIDELKYNFYDSFSQMNIKLGDVLDISSPTIGLSGAGAIAGSFIPVVGTIMGAAVGAGLGLISGIMKKSVFGDGGKSKAVKNMNDQLDVCSNELKNSLKSTILQLKYSMDNFGKIIDDYLNTELTNIRKLDSDFNALVKQIRY